MRIVDTLIVFRILKMLTTPFVKTQAYKFGFIDKNGKRITHKPDPKNPAVKLENKPTTSDEKSSLTPLHRLVFNLKKLIEKIPFGKSAFASYAVALALLKEETNLDSEQTDQLYEDFYRLLKEEGVFEPEMLEEATEVGKLCSLKMNGSDYNLRRQLKQNFEENGEIKIYPEKTKITDVKESCIGYGVLIYEGRIDEDKVLFTAEDVY